MKKWPIALIGIILGIACNEKSETLFELLPSSRSGITFNNAITETDSMNPIDVTNIYNGGGVAAADFNNDGLTDLYFTGNMVANRLYLNKGDMRFEDITNASGTEGEGKWCRGAAAVDINNDGWMDIYVCATIYDDPEQRRNILYINQGLDKFGRPTFRNMAREYGLDDTTHSTMAAFFDYDNDGDLDMYLVVNQVFQHINPSIFKPKVLDGSFPSTGRLYQNNFDAEKGHPVFSDVSKHAGVTAEGYGHGVTIADINKDGWKDFFVTNDFAPNDLLYINNKNGTFTDMAHIYFKHTSANGMGQDIIDINNDGLPDIVELDMSPEDNFRKKMMLNPGSYNTYQLSDAYNYQYQYVRNSLQVNLGPRVNGNDSVGEPVFADLGFYSGIAETDWSWAPVVADLNNDGLRDIVVTNGYPRDVTDHDFMVFRRESVHLASIATTLSRIPQVKLHNYAYRNAGDCRFEDVSKDWGFMNATFANGATYADLDNDGDLDLVVNNINDEASVYRNTLNDKKTKPHYLDVQLKGEKNNLNGLGAWVEIYYKGQQQVYEQTPYRGYLGTVQFNPHFGLDTVSVVDSLVVKWPEGKMQVLKNVPADQTVVVNSADANLDYSWENKPVAAESLFTDITGTVNLNYVHSQQDCNDFNTQKLLPHKFSEYGPSMAAGDVNGDGLDDLIIGGNSSLSAVLLLQQRDGRFIKKEIGEIPSSNFIYQDMGIALFDADNDNYLDLYIARGGYESNAESEAYTDVLYLNDGKGNFKKAANALPANFTSKSCARPFDFDKDGDLDLFIGGRVVPGQYPKPVSAHIYRNDSKGGQVVFTDVTDEVAPALKNIGLVCDALVSDYDNDGWPDLVLAGEWMPVTFLKNTGGKFENITASTGIANHTGWWTSLAAGDFDNDGDMDYIAGNLGQNSFFKASEQEPVTIYAKDFDNNDSYDAFISLYLLASMDTLERREYPAHLRDDAIRQMISMRAKFKDYKSYANATMKDLLTPEQLADAYIAKATQLNSCYIRNDGHGKFTISPLPWLAQQTILNSMIVEDFDGDGNLDVVINTNDYSTNVSIGRYDALNGLLMLGDGHGNFKPQSTLQSGIFISGNGKAMVKLRSAKGEYLLAASQNRGPLKLFRLKKTGLLAIGTGPAAYEALIRTPDGKDQKRELYSSGFLSQSARFIMYSEHSQFKQHD